MTREPIELESCSFYGCTSNLDFQFRQAIDKKHRYGQYDAAIFCRKCYCYGPRVKSEDVLGLGARIDHRNETPAPTYKEAMRKVALEKWNKRVRI